MIVASAFECAESICGNGAWPVVALRAIGIAHRRHGSRRRDQIAPFYRIPVSYCRNVRLAWFASAIVIVAYIDATTLIVAIFIGETEGCVTHFVQCDFV